MGNCQTIDNAALLIQHPNGKVEKQYSPVNVNQIMKMNPGHYVALLLTITTTTMSPPANTSNIPLRITRIKLLKPTDSLVLGHIYRLVTAQEVMKGLCAKKYAKQKQLEYSGENKQDKMTQILHSKAAVHQDKVKHRKSIGAKSRVWHPSLQSISEAAG